MMIQRGFFVFDKRRLAGYSSIKVGSSSFFTRSLVRLLASAHVLLSRCSSNAVTRNQDIDIVTITIIK